MSDVTWMTTKEYAAVMHKHEQSVRDMCASGEIDAMKVGSVWRIPYVEPAQLQAEARMRKIVSGLCLSYIESIEAQIDVLTRLRELLMVEIDGGDDDEGDGEH